MSLTSHYDFEYKGIRLDPYRILAVYDHIVDPELQHALKKLLRAGRGTKSLEQDVEEVILTLEAWKRRKREDGRDFEANVEH